MVYLGIDVGTQSSKALALDVESGEILGKSVCKHKMIEDLDLHHAEQDPAIWLEAANKVILSCLDKLGPRKSEVQGIGVSGQQHGLVLLNERDGVIRPAKLWCDTSTSKECEELTHLLGGEERVIDRVGNPMITGYTASKILWVKKNEPENYAKIRSILLPHDYINFWLTGKKSMEYGDASGTALFDVENREWSDQVIDAIDPAIKDWLPEVSSSLRLLGPLSEIHKKNWGLSQEVQVSIGSGDNMLGALGTANISEGTATVSLGTSGTIYASSQEVCIDPKGEIAAFCSAKDDWLPLFCTLNSTLVIKMIAEHYKWTQQELESLVTRGEPGAEGISFLPYVSGERTPNLPDGVGVFHGITMLNFTQENVARAMVEGASLGLGHGLNRLRELGLTIENIHITGGGSKSPAWRQLLADMFGLPVVSHVTTEGAALGAAIHVASISGEGSISDLVSHCVKEKRSDFIEPNKDNYQLYQDLIAKKFDLTDTLAARGYL